MKAILISKASFGVAFLLVFSNFLIAQTTIYIASKQGGQFHLSTLNTTEFSKNDVAQFSSDYLINSLPINQKTKSISGSFLSGISANPYEYQSISLVDHSLSVSSPSAEYIFFPRWNSDFTKLLGLKGSSTGYTLREVDLETGATEEYMKIPMMGWQFAGECDLEQNKYIILGNDSLDAAEDTRIYSIDIETKEILFKPIVQVRDNQDVAIVQPYYKTSTYYCIITNNANDSIFLSELNPENGEVSNETFLGLYKINRAVKTLNQQTGNLYFSAYDPALFNQLNRLMAVNVEDPSQKQISDTLGFDVYDLAVYDPNLVGVSDNISDFHAIKLWPNPSNVEFHISLPNYTEKAMVTLTSVEGKVMKEVSVSSSKPTINTSDIPSGVYWLNVTNSSGSSFAASRFVVCH